MNTTIGVAGSRGRVAIVTIETFLRSGERKPTSVVRGAKRLREGATPDEVRAAVRSLTDAIKDDSTNIDGDEPRVVVSCAGAGLAVWEILRADRDRGLRAHRPTGITTYSGSDDPRIERVARARSASTSARMASRLSFGSRPST